MLKNSILDQFQINVGTKVLLRYRDNRILVSEEVATITSISPCNKDLYNVTFDGKKKIYALSIDELIRLKKAYQYQDTL